MKVLFIHLILIFSMSNQGLCKNHTFLQFVKRPTSAPHPKVIQVFESKSIDWYASWPTKLLLEVYDAKPFSIRLNCSVETLKHEERITKMYFCFYGRKNAFGKCIMNDKDILTKESVKGCIAYDRNSNSEEKVKLGIGIEVFIEFDPYTGGIAEIRNVSTDIIVSVKFQCEIRNDRGAIKSNMIEILDYRNIYQRETLLCYDEPKRRLNANGPSNLPCYKRHHTKCKNDLETFTPHYAWYLCPHRDHHILIDRKVQCDLFKWTNDSSVQLLPDGNLYFPFVTTKLKEQIKDKYPFCTINSEMYAVLRRPILITDAKLENQVETLTITQPQADMKIHLMNDSSIRVQYYCNFKVGRGNVSVVWKKYDENGTFAVITEAFNPIYRVQRIEFYGLQFSGPFNKATYGDYTCEVSWTPIGRSTITKEASFSVSIINFPQLSPEVPSVVFVYPGSNGSVECKFEHPVYIGIRFNENSLNLRDPRLMQRDFNNFVKKINSDWQLRNGMSSPSALMTPLNITMHPIEKQCYHRLSSIRYTALDMQETDPISNATSSHQISCIGHNGFAQVDRSILLLVVPRIKMSKEAGREDVRPRCESGNGIHLFRCEIANREEYRQLDYEVRVKQYWRIGETYLDSRLKYVFISHNETLLTILGKPVLSPAGIQSPNVTCVITMEYPSELQQPDDLLPGPFNTKVFYHSDYDENLENELTYECDLS